MICGGVVDIGRFSQTGSRILPIRFAVIHAAESRFASGYVASAGGKENCPVRTIHQVVKATRLDERPNTYGVPKVIALTHTYNMSIIQTLVI